MCPWRGARSRVKNGVCDHPVEVVVPMLPLEGVGLARHGDSALRLSLLPRPPWSRARGLVSSSSSVPPVVTLYRSVLRPEVEAHI